MKSLMNHRGGPHMELQYTQWPSRSFCASSSTLPCQSSVSFFHVSLPLHLLPPTAERLTIVAKAQQSDSKAAPPRPELWELREYEDPDEDVDEKKAKGRRRSFATEAEAKRHHWISRMWAPWEEALSPEAQFAVDALNLDQGDEPIVPQEMMDRLNVNEPLIPDAIYEGREEVPEDPDVIEAREMGEIPGTAWKETMAFSLIPPRDWPPPGWKVDPDELAFIRDIHRIMDTHVTPFDLSTAASVTEENQGSFPRWNMFLKQYEEWVAANKERLDREAEELGDEYYPGRRRTGKEYTEGMYELPFIYPGQHYLGKVTMVHLYEGAFINFGAVHDGWVPIKRNDWWYIRKIIKVGMRVQVEVIAKRDPYRFRFPVQMRFVYPNIDHLIFNKFEYPPIFVRDDEEKHMDLVTREADRPFWPRRRPADPEKEEEMPPQYNQQFVSKKAREEAEAKAEPYEQILNIEELDVMNWQRYLDEHEAVQRDRVNRLEFGMPLEEPGKYADDSFFGENKYNPREKRWRHDYIGDVSKSKDESKQQRERQTLDDEEKVKKDDSRSSTPRGRKGSKLVDLPRGSKDEAIGNSTSSFKKSGAVKDNGDTVVNGTESSTIPGMMGSFKIRDEEQSEDENE